jgi:hypothetical protein
MRHLVGAAADAAPGQRAAAARQTLKSGNSVTFHLAARTARAPAAAI